MGLVWRDALDRDGEESYLWPEITHHTLMNSGGGGNHVRMPMNGPHLSLRTAPEPVFSVWQQGNDLVMRRILNYLLRLIHFLFFSYDGEDAWS